jgi:flavodoxin
MRNVSVLIVYYSRGGATRHVAERLAHWLDCDMEALHDRTSRGGWCGAVRSWIDAALGRRARLEPPQRHPADYDLVLVGTPVWAASVAPAVRAFLKQYRLRLNRVAYFCTYSGTGSGRALRQMSRITHRSPVATLAVRQEDMRTGAWEGAAAAFLARLKTAERPAPMTRRDGRVTAAAER